MVFLVTKTGTRGETGWLEEGWGGRCLVKFSMEIEWHQMGSSWDHETVILAERRFGNQYCDVVGEVTGLELGLGSTVYSCSFV